PPPSRPTTRACGRFGPRDRWRCRRCTRPPSRPCDRCSAENYKLVVVAPLCEPRGVPGTTLETAAARLAALLTGGGAALADPAGSDLEFEPEIRLRPLVRGSAPLDVWAVDGGQCVVADARCLQLLVTRAARVRFRDGRCELEEEGSLDAHVVGGGEARAAVDALGLGVAADASLEGVANLLRDGGEWRAV